MSAYDSVQTGGLKLKGLSDGGVKKKKKKKSKDKTKETAHLELSLSSEDAEPSSSSAGSDRLTYVPRKTKAEQAFETVKEKRAELILKKAKTTHKEQIMELNKHLDSLTEHFDIPKVSWTK